MSTLLSVAMRRGAAICPREAVAYFAPDNDSAPVGSDPLGAALIGSMREQELANFWAFRAQASNESLAEYMIKSLHRTWPALGQSVRAWPRLAERLESERLVPHIRTYQTQYRQAVHLSLWKALTDLYDRRMNKAEIADLLAGVGL